MQELLHQIGSGVAMGGIYACLAVALVLIYRSTGHVNFAQGEMAMFSAFIALTCLNAGLGYWLSALIAVGFGFLSGVFLERVVMRRLHHGPAMSFTVACVALFIGVNALASWVFHHGISSFPSPFGTAPSVIPLLSTHELGTILVVGVVVALLYGFFQYTSIGLAMRATADNPESARLSGIPVERLLMFGWGLAAGIGAVAALLIAPVVFLDPHMMTGVLIYAFAAALIGGLDNPWGAIVGGLIVGVTENVAGAYLVGNDLKLSVALVLILGVLLVFPQGLFGRRIVTRV